MVASSSRLAYADCFDLLERAMADSRGIRIKFGSVEQARLFRLRLHSARKVDRRDNTQIYGDDHKMAGRSIYDGLVVRIRQEEGVWWLRVERLDAQVFEVESLSEPQPVVQSLKRRV